MKMFARPSYLTPLAFLSLLCSALVLIAACTPVYIERDGPGYVGPSYGGDGYIQPPPNYGRGVPPPVRGGRGRGPNSSAAVASLKDSLNRMFGVVRQYGPDSYDQLRREMRDMDGHLDNVLALIGQRQNPQRINDAFTNVERAATVIDTRVRGINADMPIRSAWGEVVAELQQASAALDYRAAGNGNQQQPNGPNGEVIQAGDQLVGLIDAYCVELQSKAALNPQAPVLQREMTNLRIEADAFRQAAHGGTSRQSLRGTAQNLANHYNRTTPLFTRLSADPRFNSAYYSQIGQAVNRLYSTVQ